MHRKVLIGQGDIHTFDLFALLLLLLLLLLTAMQTSRCAQAHVGSKFQVIHYFGRRGGTFGVVHQQVWSLHIRVGVHCERVLLWVRGVILDLRIEKVL